MAPTKNSPFRSATMVATLTTTGLILAACGGEAANERAGSTISEANTVQTDRPTPESSATASKTSAPSASKAKDRGEKDTAAAQSSVTTSNELEPMAGSQPLDVLPSQGAQLQVVEVRNAGHRDFDRFVVELSGEGQPGWYVNLKANPTASGSGHPIEYKGQQAMVVGIRGIEAPINPDGSIRPRLPKPVPGPDTKIISSIEDEGWFEGDQRFILGMNKRQPEFKINLLTGPTRVVIDIMH